MRKFLLLIIYIFLLDLSNLNASVFEYKFEKEENYSILKISFEIEYPQFLQQNDGYKVTFPNTNEAIFSEENLNFQDIQLIVALPNNQIKEFKYNFNDLEYLGNYSISDKPIENEGIKFLKNRVKRDFIEQDISLKYLGKMRGIDIFSITITPFKYNKFNNDIFFSRSGVLYISFSNILGCNLSRIDYKNTLYRGINNLSELKDFLNKVEFPQNLLNKVEENDAFNLWYKPDFEYINFATSRDGIAVIKSADIVKYGDFFIGKNVDYLHLIHNGKECYFYATNLKDNKLTENSEIYFLGRRPQGDTTFYDSYAKYENFYMYYDESSKGLIFNNLPKVENGNNLIEKVFINKHFEKEGLYIFKGVQSEKEPGEGWFWTNIYPPDKSTFLDTIKIFPAENYIDSLNFEISFESTYYNEFYSINHNVEFSINDKFKLSRELEGGKRYNLSLKISNNELNQGENILSFKTLGRYNEINELIKPDEIGIDYFEISGYVKPIVSFPNFNFFLPNLNSDSYLEISGFNNNRIVAIDTINNYLVFADAVFRNDSYVIKIGLEKDKSYFFFVADSNDFENALVNKVNITNLASDTNKANVLVLYHSNFKAVAEEYQKYRAENSQKEIKVVDVEDVYKEFGYGRMSPHSIKNFLRYAFKYWEHFPEYLVLLGDASWDTRNVLPTSIYKNYIPSYGIYVSDYWYSLIDGNDYLPELIIGRIPIFEVQQGFDYLDKIKTFENMKYEEWQKRFLFLSGGIQEGEIKRFRDVTQFYAKYVKDSELCADTVIVSKNDAVVVGDLQGPLIRSKINEGNIWVSFMGHGSPLVFDMDGWQVERLNNKGKYYFFSAYSCNTGAFAEPNLVARSEDYLYTKDKGAIATMGTTGAGIGEIHQELEYRILGEVIKKNAFSRRLSDILYSIKPQMVRNDLEIMTAMQYLYFGDPLLSFPFTDNPNIFFSKNSININEGSEKLIVTDTFALIKGKIINTGFNYPFVFDLILIRTYKSIVDTFYYQIFGVCYKQDFEFYLPIYDMPGLHKVKIIIDPDRKTNEVDYSDNTIEFQFEVLNAGILVVDPQPYWNFNGSQPIFRFIDSSPNYERNQYILKIYKLSNDSLELYYNSRDYEILKYDVYFDWKPTIFLEREKHFLLEAYSYIEGSDTHSDILRIPFNTYLSDSIATVEWRQGLYSELCDNDFENLILSKNNEFSSIKIEDKKFPFRLTGSQWDEELQYSNCEIIFNNQVIVEIKNPWDIPRGFNIVVISGIDGSFKEKRNFDTWGLTDWWNDSSSIKMVKFLKDSVDKNDYVLMATCNAAFRLFVLYDGQKSLGGFDSLRYYLKQYGSTLADSLRYGCSYVFLGKKNSDYVFEGWNPTGDRITIEDSLTISFLRGKMITNAIGPAKKWESFNINGKFLNEKNLSIELIGINRDTGIEVFLKNDTGKNLIELNDIDASNYPFLKFKIELNREKADQNVEINSLYCKYIPATELAVSTSNSYVINDPILRGDSSKVKVQIQNLSLRTIADSTDLKVRVLANVEKEQYETTIDRILPNSFYETDVLLPSDNFDNINNIVVSINNSKKDIEFYFFNNYLYLKQYVNDDTIGPYIEVEFDGRKIQNGSVVQRVPQIKIYLYDNSKLPLPLQITPIIRLNGRVQNATTTKNFILQDFGRNVPLKAVVSFEPDSLDFKDNMLTVELRDASDNKIKVNYIVYVSDFTQIENVKIYPHPVEKNSYIKFDYLAPISEGFAKIEIFNYTGQLISSFEDPVKVGENVCLLRKYDNYNRLLPPGVYFYKISIINSSFIVEPVFGKFLVIY